MDSGQKIKREENPRERANIFSVLSFFFTFNIIRKGVKKDLKEDDIYEITRGLKSQKLGDDLEKLWKNELLKPSPSLIPPLIKLFGFEYLIIWITIFCMEVTFMVGRPILTGKVVSYFEPNTEITRNEALMYTAGLVFVIFVFSTYDPYFLVTQQTIAMKIRIACSSLLYRKCLKLSSSSSAQYAASGTMITLLTKDLIQINSALDSVLLAVNNSIYVIIMTIIMYRAIGIATLAGTSILLILLPIEIYLGRKAAMLRLRTLRKTDQRVRLTQEIFTAIRIIKMYTWELVFSKSLKQLRKDEVKSLRWLIYVKAFALALGELSSRLAFYICVATYLSLGNHITAENAFIVAGGFKALDQTLTIVMPTGIAQIAEMKKSINRVMSFLLLDEVTTEELAPKQFNKPRICLENVTVRTAVNVEVLQGVNMEINQGLTVVSGNVGSGKSTLLKVLLGDVTTDHGTVEVSGKMSYSSQEPWLFPGSVRQNIIFGGRFDQERYSKIVQVCALEKDFLSLVQGDLTCLVDKGLNLSRGQKTRINLARAIYREADIYLLDDCFSAVDTHVGKHIFKECIKKFLNNKICVLVTHNSEFLKEADNIMILDNGLSEFRRNSEIPFNSIDLHLQDLKTNEDVQGSVNAIQDKPPSSENDKENIPLLEKTNRNIYSEIKEEGSVKKEVYFELFKLGGGVKIVIVVLFFAVVAQSAASWSDYFVSYWVDTEQHMSGFRFNKTTYSVEYKRLEDSHDEMMIHYSLAILGAATFTMLRSFTFIFFFTKVSMNIHAVILHKIMNAKMLFFDKNLSGNVVNRFSRDLGILDEQLPPVAFDVLRTILEICGTFLIISSINLYFVIPSLIFTASLYLARRLYVPTGRSIKRLEGITRSPVIGHLNATFEGLITIRANQAQTALKDEFDQHQDHYNSVNYIYWTTLYSFNWYLNMIATIYTATILFTFLFMRTDSQAGDIGLAITQSFGLSAFLRVLFRQWGDLGNQMTSAERVLEYTKIKTEDNKGEKVVDWPSRGKIIYKGVNLQYTPTSERVLKDVTLVIEPKAKIGIVGRTGAGKSSTIACLFKMYEFEGLISIDDKDINSLDVSQLRSHISIIPQDPVLFSGTIRMNLDPKEQFDDKELWLALGEVEMKNVVDSLDSEVVDSGFNYSVGQRQLICLARAVVHKSKILILDEATANIDPETDKLVQQTVKRVFCDCTVITVAHRLNTIMDSDKVVVMDSGIVVEYDSPEKLLENKIGIFYKMIQEAGLM